MYGMGQQFILTLDRQLLKNAFDESIMWQLIIDE